MKKFFKKKSADTTVKDHFNKYLGTSIEESQHGFEEKEFCYCLVKIPFEFDNTDKGESILLVSKLVELADRQNGDINSFSGDTLAIFFGLPLPDKDLYRDILGFVQQVVEMKKNIKVLIGEDKGLYGRFGYENRYLVTVLSRNLTIDHERLQTLAEGNVYIQNNLAMKFKPFKKIQGAIILGGSEK